MFHGFSTWILILVISATIESILIGFETLRWIPVTTLDTQSLQILDVPSLGANGPKIWLHKNIQGQHLN